MDTSCMTQIDCMALAQCLRDSILTLARGEFAYQYRASNYSASYDDYIIQHFAQQVQWMQHLFNQAGNPVDMTLFREEITALRPRNIESYQNNSSLITFDEAAKILRKSINTINRWRREGRCPGMFKKIGAAWYIDREKLHAV